MLPTPKPQLKDYTPFLYFVIPLFLALTFFFRIYQKEEIPLTTTPTASPTAVIEYHCLVVAEDETTIELECKK